MDILGEREVPLLSDKLQERHLIQQCEKFCQPKIATEKQFGSCSICMETQ